MTALTALRAPKWHVHAACRNADQEVDWIDTEPGSKAAADCKETWRLCPVRLTCAITALTTDESYGVWGGMDQVDREALRRADAQIAA
jgi:WhiB family redox-sensing transcriptional regulator